MDGAYALTFDGGTQAARPLAGPTVVLTAESAEEPRLAIGGWLPRARPPQLARAELI